MGNDSTFSTTDITGSPIQFSIEELLAAYVTVRSVYFLRFLIHYELYYGSRPDRLSRLYTVKFGTFDAFKFLINEKPMIILMVIFFLNYLLLPLQLLLIEGYTPSHLAPSTPTSTISSPVSTTRWSPRLQSATGTSSSSPLWGESLWSSPSLSVSPPPPSSSSSL